MVVSFTTSQRTGLVTLNRGVRLILCPWPLELTCCLGTGWTNVEYRSYRFLDDEGNENASVEETVESRAHRRGTEKPLTETEQIQLERVTKNSMEINEVPPLQAKA